MTIIDVRPPVGEELLPRPEETDMGYQFWLMSGFLHEQLYGLPVDEGHITEIVVDTAVAAEELAQTLARSRGIDPELDIFTECLIQGRLIVNNRGEPDVFSFYVDSDEEWQTPRVDEAFTAYLARKALQIAGAVVTEYEEELHYLDRMADSAVTDYVMATEARDNIEPSVEQRILYRQGYLEAIREYKSQLDFIDQAANTALAKWVKQAIFKPSSEERAAYRDNYLEDLKRLLTPQSEEPADNTGTETQ